MGHVQRVTTGDGREIVVQLIGRVSPLTPTDSALVLCAVVGRAPDGFRGG